MSLELPFGLRILNPVPVQSYAYNTSDQPFTNTAQAISQITSAVRFRGLTVFVEDGSGGVVEYWFRDGTADGDLILKTSASSGAVSITFSQLTDLSDVNINNPYSNQYLRYNGNNWINATISNLVNLDYISFDTTAAYEVSQGEMAWNSDEETLDLGLNGAVLQLGQEIHYHVRNNSGSSISDGTPVYATGTLGASGRITIAPYVNNNTIDSKYILGITTETIANDTDGKVTFFGKIRNINTSGTPYSETWNDGDLIYLGSTAGTLTNIQPQAPNIHQPIAIVIHAASNGTIFIRVPSFHSIGNLEDVYLATVSNNNILSYNTSNLRWENNYTIVDTIDSNDVNSIPTENATKTYTDNEFTKLNQEFISSTYSTSFTIDWNNINYTYNGYMNLASDVYITLTQSISGSQFFIDVDVDSGSTNNNIYFIKHPNYNIIYDQSYINSTSNGLQITGDAASASYYTLIGWFNGVNYRININDVWN